MRTRLTSFVATILLLVPPVAAFAQAPYTAARQPPSTANRERAMAPYRLGLERLKTEAWEEAVTAFRSAIEIDHTFEMAHYMLGRTHMFQKKYADASVAYERCRALYQAQSGRQYATAQERQRDRDTRLREIDEVIRSYRAVTNQTPQVIDAIRQLENQKRLVEEAMSRSNTTMSVNLAVPSYVSTALGSAYFRMGNLAGAEKEYKAAIEADGKSGEAYSNLAVVYMETGRLDHAEMAVKEAEKVGFKVHPQLKEEIKNRRKAGTN